MTTTTDEAGAWDVVLFYKYARVNDPEEVLRWSERYCRENEILGRVRLAPEGVNGTLGGLGDAVARFIADSEMAHPDLFVGTDWKRSVSREPPFPDLKLEIRGDICSHGPVIPRGADYVEAHGGLHLSPEDFHAALRETEVDEDAVVIDVRNHYESSVGKFNHPRLLVPNTRTFAEYPRWLRDNKEKLEGKRVLMYCTGGIRCEKASAYIRAEGVADRVEQLRGGIHRYLEAFPDGGAWVGNNFVFDGRVVDGGGGNKNNDNNAVDVSSSSAAAAGDAAAARGVGVEASCESCGAPGAKHLGCSAHEGSRVCCVCRDLVLCCDACWDSEAGGPDLFCLRHRDDGFPHAFYRTRLERFDVVALMEQREGLLRHHEKLLELKDKGRNRRRTIRRQLERVEAAMSGATRDNSGLTGGALMRVEERND